MPPALGRISSAAGQRCSSACKPLSQGHCREIPPFADPCITQQGPDPGLILPKAWVEAGRRGHRGAGVMEKTQKRVMGPSSRHTCPSSSLTGAPDHQCAGNITL